MQGGDSKLERFPNVGYTLSGGYPGVEWATDAVPNLVRITSDARKNDRKPQLQHAS